MAKFLNEDEQASPEDVEFIAQYFPNPIPENLVTRNFHKCALKYGKGKRSGQELRMKGQEILYRPGGIRSQLLEERFNEKAATLLFIKQCKMKHIII